MFCPRCGTQMPDGSAFCVRCGLPLTGYQNQGQPTGWNSLPTGGGLYPYPQQQYPQLQQPPVAEKKPKKPKEEPKPDPTFSKFIDGPEEPIPFYLAKIAIGILSILGAAWLMYQCYQLGTFRLLAMHAKSNIRGLSLLICAVLWIFAAVCGFASKFSRGAAGCGGCLYLFSIGIAVTRQADYEHFLWAAIAAGIFAVVFLISAAGGVNINLDD